jgi:hypothetical protein
MGPTLLLACLWGIVLAYWLWSRRPLGDPVGSFRHELQVLGRTTPARVAPANRLRPSQPVFVGSTQKRFVDPREMVNRPVPLAAAARDHTREELRRRRRHVIGTLGAAALLTLFAAVLTGSVMVALLQVFIDVALVAYVYLLARATAGPGKGSQSGFRPRSNGFVKPAVSTVRLAGTGYMRGHVLAGNELHEPSYGDFGSYASLAISQGH